jgi:hypothetical protein
MLAFWVGDMPAKKSRSKRGSQRKPRARPKKREQEAGLEQALEDTFPSSDPVALTQPTVASKKKSRR